MDIKLERLGEIFRKQTEPACSCCGYDAEWIIRVGTLDKFFCERCIINALLDALNFNCAVPEVAPAA